MESSLPATLLFVLIAYVTFAILYTTYRVVINLRKRAKWDKGTEKLYSKYPKTLLGVASLLRKNRFRRMEFFMESYGPDSLTCKLETAMFQPAGMIHTMDPKLIEHVLKTNVDSYVKDLVPVFPPINPVRTLLGGGIFSVNHGPHVPDEGWFNQRKLAALIFKQKNFRESFMDVFLRNGKTLVEQLGDVKQGEQVDLQKLFFRYTMDSFGEIGFGIQFNTLLNKGGEVEAFPTAFDAAHATLIPILNKVVPMAFLVDLLPFPLRDIGLWALTTFHPDYVELNKQNKILDKYCYSMIHQRRSEANVDEKQDLLSLFMTATNPSPTNKPKGSPTSSADKFLRDILLNMFIAGRDTTACTLSWLFFRLTKEPEVFQTLQAEIDAHLGKELPNYSNVKDLKYLHGCIYETLRLYPPVPVDPKMACVKDTLPDGTVCMPGTIFVYFPWGMGRCKALWGDDPLKFDPTRWIDADPKSAFEFPVFQAGPRMCVGKDMAVLESKVAAAMMVQHFVFEAVPGQLQDENYTLLLTMAIRDGFRVFVKPRAAE